VINQLELKNSAGFDGSSGEADIRFRWAWVTGWMIVNHDKGIGGMDDSLLKDFARVGQRLIDGALADGSDLDQVLLGVEENNAERFAIEKTHLGAQLGECQRAIDRERLSLGDHRIRYLKHGKELVSLVKRECEQRHENSNSLPQTSLPPVVSGTSCNRVLVRLLFIE
jgi:hypothetical protein